MDRFLLVVFLVVATTSVSAQPREYRVPIVDSGFIIGPVCPDSTVELFWGGMSTGLFVPLAIGIYDRVGVDFIRSANKWLLFKTRQAGGGTYQATSETVYYYPFGGKSVIVRSFGRNGRWGGSSLDSIIAISDKPLFRMDYKRSESYQNGFYWTSRRCVWSPDSGCQFDILLSSSWTPPTSTVDIISSPIVRGGVVQKIGKLDLLGRTLRVNGSFLGLCRRY